MDRHGSKLLEISVLKINGSSKIEFELVDPDLNGCPSLETVCGSCCFCCLFPYYMGYLMVVSTSQYQWK
jgi:hypothetical protein